MSVGESIQRVLDLGVREFVVCAGARNLAVVSALASQEEVYLWSHFEERSAGFFALGRTMTSGEPCAVVTTSGTAVAELLPAVIEAYYQARPLIVVSADRPAAYRGSGAPQAIEQLGIFSDYVENCMDITDGASEAIQWSGSKPLHVNICIEEGATVCADFRVIPFQRSREKIMVGEVVRFVSDVWDGLVVAIGGLEPEDREEVFHFVRDLKVPVIADATSGLREAFGKQLVARPEELLRRGMIGKLLRVGDVPVGRFWRDLEKMTQIEVMSVTRTGFSGLARQSTVVKGEISRILKGMGHVEEVGDVMDSLSQNSRHWALCDELLEAYPDSEPGMMRVLSQYASVSELLYLGNSLPVREWNQFAQRDLPVEFVRANRGANGIDGQVSTWLGVSAGIEDSWAVVGDLTALYDMAGLALLDQVGGSRRVLVVINNQGGRIFERLPSVKAMDEDVQELITNDHQVDFSHLASLWKMDYILFEEAVEMEIEAGEAPLLVELRPDAEQTEAFWKRWSVIDGQ